MNSNFDLSHLDYHLPDNLIAQQPTLHRTDAKLLVVDKQSGKLFDKRIPDIVDYVEPDDLVIFNNTSVIPARFFMKRESGGMIEGLFIMQYSFESELYCQVMLKNAKRLMIGESLILLDRKNNNTDVQIEIVKQENDGKWIIKSDSDIDFEILLQMFGHTPLPPYIKRNYREHPDEFAKEDNERYQTVYAENPGSVAAPTAGLHFTEELIDKIRNKGVHTDFVTLHVGLGTFKPIETDDISNHIMHSEQYQIPKSTVNLIDKTKLNGKRVIAIGTTTVRTLESFADSKPIETPAMFPYHINLTNIFIYPPFDFKIVDVLFTNFHLPQSTLLALVMAFAGIDNIKSAYRHAVDNNYRFFSYGDAMLII